MTNSAPLIKLILCFTFRMDTRLEQRDGVSCSLNLLSRARYSMPNPDVGGLEEDGTCNQYLGNIVHYNSLRQLMTVEDKPSIYKNWAQDPPSSDRG